MRAPTVKFAQMAIAMNTVALLDLCSVNASCSYERGRLNTNTELIVKQYCEGQLKSTLHRELKAHEAAGD